MHIKVIIYFSKKDEDWRDYVEKVLKVSNKKNDTLLGNFDPKTMPQGKDKNVNS